MPGQKFLKCRCAHCGGSIEFPPDGVGVTIPCPHCGSDTELTLAAPEPASQQSSRSLKWALAGIIILIAGVVGILAALNIARKLLPKPRTTPGLSRPSSVRGSTPTTFAPPFRTNDFTASRVRIETNPSSNLAYAVGVIKNELDAQRFGITVEIDVFDQSGAKIGTARDYRDVMEAGGDWSFRALLLKGAAGSARVSSIREEP